jgi:adenylate cyclase
MNHPHLKRRLKAILLADVVGYSRLMNLDEAGTHIKVNNYTKDLIEPKIAEHGGRLIRTMGDGFLVEFDSAADAVACGLEIQEGLRRDDATSDGDRRIWLRIGINTGDVIADDRDIYGHSVNIAARLEGLAERGEVYVTRAVHDQLEGQAGLSFEDRGERRVKNIRTPIHVYRVKRAEAPPHFLIAIARRFSPARLRFTARGTVFSGAVAATLVSVGVVGLPMWRDQSDVAPRASIVVLPFENFSGDPAETYFADAVTDDLTTDLSRLPGTFVISRATAFTYKGKAVDVRQVGRECNVRYALEGSIRRVGTLVQTNAQLIDTATAAHIWADRFENETSDLFALQKAITGRIAASLDIQLARAEGQRARERAADPSAVDLRLHAIALYINGVTAEHLLTAGQLLEQSVQLDPNLAESWSWLAEILVTQYLHRWNNVGKEALEQAEEAIAKAVAINPNVAQAYYTQGLIRRAKGDQLGAFEALSRAVEVNPNLPRALAEKANQLTSLGRPADAPQLVEKAIKLSPRDPALGGFYWIIGRAYFVSGDYRNAIPWLQKSVALRQSDWYPQAYLVSAYALDLQKDEAKKALQRFNDNPRFAGYTLQSIAEEMKVLPNDNPLIVSARQKVHEGLRIAGMAAH